jgi:ABC-2 type transport system ATP-binding protein
VGVDMQAREAIAEALRRLQGDGVGVLLVTHDLDQAQRLSDRVGFLRDGEKVLEGAPEALIADAFGDRMEVEIEVVEPAPEAVLAAEGLTRADEPGPWVCLASDGYALAGSIALRLKAKGVEVREVRVRRPSLSQVFARVVGPRRAA